MLTEPLSFIHKRQNRISRSICPENPTGEKGMGGRIPVEEGSASQAARELGTGWKVNPYTRIKQGDTCLMAEIEGPGCIHHLWMIPFIGKLQDMIWRNLILRMYWDGQSQPSVECPLGDFFFNGWEKYQPVTSAAVCVNPNRAFNCYWPMPFAKSCIMTLENQNEFEVLLYYQIDYSLGDIEPDDLYFHAQFRRVNPLPTKEVYTLLDGVQGAGQYVGTYMAWGSNSNGWWGEGEIKFYLDGDKDFPTICGTGTEDYFCGAYGFYNNEETDYQAFNTPYAGLCQVIHPDGLYSANTRFGLYRLHLPDPIYFKDNLRVTIQALGWRSGGRYLPLQDDIASVAYWYQTLPTAPFPVLPDKDAREVI